jgi:hypothetical protein
MRTYLVLFFILYPILLPAFSDMVNGVGINESNKDLLWGTSIPYAIARQGQRTYDDREYVVGYIEIGDSVYSVSSKPSLLKTIVEGRKVDAGWPLTRWPHLNYPQELKARRMAIGATEENIGQPWYTPEFKKVGCLGNVPLRYGKLLTGGEDYIVLYLTGQMMVFSPQYQRVVFAEYLEVNDWYSAEQSRALVTDWRRGEQQYQHISSRLAGFHLGNEEPGYRFYAKLYIDDFDKDGNPDIVVWRKGYKTRDLSDSVSGFSLIRNEWQHYEQDLKTQEESPQGITGEYLPQATDEATIKTWLTNNHLTWQKGYPDKSECPGEEGKPISEMSDPLLNDPEVMQ